LNFQAVAVAERGRPQLAGLRFHAFFMWTVPHSAAHFDALENLGQRILDS